MKYSRETLRTVISMDILKSLGRGFYYLQCSCKHNCKKELVDPKEQNATTLSLGVVKHVLKCHAFSFVFI
jgi:hypothetical protein